MGDARSRQLRMGRKRRRRQNRRRGSVAGVENGRAEGELKYAVQWVVSPDGVGPDPRRLAELHATLMSDALVELMEPYICWPPGRDEVGDLEDWLQLGADVWNVVVEARDSETCLRELVRLADDLEVEDPVRLVTEIARRKFAHFPTDRRGVAAVRVITMDGRATVEATSMGYLPGASR